jgi:hypothetical protein
MKYCNFCGNELLEAVEICPYCEQPIHQEEIHSNKKKKYITFVIKQNLPTCAEAIRLLEQAIFGAKADGVKVMKIVHGYGSSGVGGELRYCLQDYLERMKNQGRIRFYVAGEEFSRQFAKGQKLLQSFPKLANDKDLNRFNKGITIVAI